MPRPDEERRPYLVRFHDGQHITTVPVKAAADAHEAVQEARLLVGPHWQLWEAVFASSS